MDYEREYDVVIVGAGIAGPALAAGFAAQGRTVLILERDLREPDRIVGELLQPGGCRALRELGLGDALKGIDAIETHGYTIISHNRPYDIPYPLNNPDNPQKGRVNGASFHHGKFVMNLRRLSGAMPGVTMVEATVNEIVRNPYTGHVIGVKATTTADRQERHFFAKLTVVSDGISSKFRKEFTTKRPIIKSYFAGLVLEDAVLPYPNHGHVIIGPHHEPVLVYQIGSNETRILCDVALPIPSNGNGDLKNHLIRKLLPNLPASLKPSVEKALEKSKIRTMPAQFLPAGLNYTHGLVMVGDALNMRHPLTGGGMTVAFKDALLLTDLLHPDIIPDLDDTHLVQKQIKSFFYQRKKTIASVNILAMALYALFASQNDENLSILQQGCLKYLDLGGIFLDGPVGLLSAMFPSPVVLFLHFFAVAYYSIFVNLFASGILGIPKAISKFVTVIWTACVVFVPLMWEEAKWW